MLGMDDKKPEEKKGLLKKLKEATDDREEQLAILSTFVRLGILVWSGGILTLAYIKLPPALGIPEQKLDQTAKKNGNGATGGAAITKDQMERLIEKAAQTAPHQTIRIEQAPMVIQPGEPPVKPTI